MNDPTSVLIVTLPEGDKIVSPVQEPPEDAPAVVREGRVRQALCLSEGRCPCGAELRLPSRQQRRFAARKGVPLRVQVEHEPDCPACDPAVAQRDGRCAL